MTPYLCDPKKLYEDKKRELELKKSLADAKRFNGITGVPALDDFINSAIDQAAETSTDAIGTAISTVEQQLGVSIQDLYATMSALTHIVDEGEQALYGMYLVGLRNEIRTRRRLYDKMYYYLSDVKRILEQFILHGDGYNKRKSSIAREYLDSALKQFTHVLNTLLGRNYFETSRHLTGINNINAAADILGGTVTADYAALSKSKSLYGAVVTKKKNKPSPQSILKDFLARTTSSAGNRLLDMMESYYKLYWDMREIVHILLPEFNDSWANSTPATISVFSGTSRIERVVRYPKLYEEHCSDIGYPLSDAEKILARKGYVLTCLTIRGYISSIEGVPATMSVSNMAIKAIQSDYSKLNDKLAVIKQELSDIEKGSETAGVALKTVLIADKLVLLSKEYSTYTRSGNQENIIRANNAALMEAVDYIKTMKDYETEEIHNQMYTILFNAFKAVMSVLGADKLFTKFTEPKLNVEDIYRSKIYLADGIRTLTRLRSADDQCLEVLDKFKYGDNPLTKSLSDLAMATNNPLATAILNGQAASIISAAPMALKGAVNSVKSLFSALNADKFKAFTACPEKKVEDNTAAQYTNTARGQ